MFSEPSRIIKFYKLQNTGWSDGQSWFTIYNERRFDTFEQAKESFKNHENDDPKIKWRIVEVIVYTYCQDKTQPELMTQKVTQERYLYVKHEQ
jgi:hypothetical protein